MQLHWGGVSFPTASNKNSREDEDIELYEKWEFGKAPGVGRKWSLHNNARGGLFLSCDLWSSVRLSCLVVWVGLTTRHHGRSSNSLDEKLNCSVYGQIFTGCGRGERGLLKLKYTGLLLPIKTTSRRFAGACQ
jgi:hypothetical protein